jgi:hypothetical protein
MHSQIDIYRTAQVLVRRHGTGAADEAGADDMQVRGNLDGAAVWRLVAAAVEKLTPDSTTER